MVQYNPVATSLFSKIQHRTWITRKKLDTLSTQHDTKGIPLVLFILFSQFLTHFCFLHPEAKFFLLRSNTRVSHFSSSHIRNLKFLNAVRKRYSLNTIFFLLLINFLCNVHPLWLSRINNSFLWMCYQKALNSSKTLCAWMKRYG